MKTILLIFISLSLGSFASASDSYNSCTDESGLFTYLPDSQELTYNGNEIYIRSSFNTHFVGVDSYEQGSCLAENGESYDYENIRYTLRFTYDKETNGPEYFSCEQGFDSLPAGQNCVKPVIKE